jgi:Mn2+/Fe2+ NRAMP family transporter
MLNDSDISHKITSNDIALIWRRQLLFTLIPILIVGLIVSRKVSEMLDEFQLFAIFLPIYVLLIFLLLFIRKKILVKDFLDMEIHISNTGLKVVYGNGSSKEMDFNSFTKLKEDALGLRITFSHHKFFIPKGFEKYACLSQAIKQNTSR